MNNRIRKIRVTAGMTQVEFASKLGLTKNFISLLENGNREPSDRTINDICRIFDVNPIWLRTGVGEPFVPLSRSDELAAIFERIEVGTDAKSRLIRAVAQIPDEAFPALLSFVEQLNRSLSEEPEE